MCAIHLSLSLSHMYSAKEPWEASDGAVHMVKELASVAPDAAAEFIPALSELASLSSFQHAFNLHETIWRALPDICKGLGVKAFKAAHLESFLHPLFADLRCGHQLAEAAAGRCISALRDAVGPRIFAGRLNDAQQRAMEADPHILPLGEASGGVADGSGFALQSSSAVRAAAATIH